MRLEFTILWFENQLRELESQIGELKDHIQSAGFIPKIELRPDASDLEELSRQQENFHEFDLVVVDWDLDGDQKGDEVAYRVRKKFGFTNILFYSGKRPGDLRDMVKEKAIDGVYCIHRRELIQRLTELIDDIVSGLSRLDAMRGLAMSTVSQCDGDLKRLITSVFASSEPELQKEIIRLLDELVGDSREKGKEKYDKCKSLEDRLSCFSVTSFHLWKLALHLTKGNGLVADRRKTLGRYNDEVLGTRNALGHAVEKRTEDGWAIEISRGDPLTKADFPKLRGFFASHRENLTSINEALIVDRGEEAE